MRNLLPFVLFLALVSEILVTSCSSFKTITYEVPKQYQRMAWDSCKTLLEPYGILESDENKGTMTSQYFSNERHPSRQLKVYLKLEPNAKKLIIKVLEFESENAGFNERKLKFYDYNHDFAKLLSHKYSRILLQKKKQKEVKTEIEDKKQDENSSPKSRKK